MKVAAIVQARMGSKRLPGKVMLKLGTKTVLNHVISRIRQVKEIDEIIVATSYLPKDNAIVNEVNKLDVSCYRGSEKDVLARYYEAAEFYNIDVIIRITADCPLLDPLLLDHMVNRYLSIAEKDLRKVNYLSNCVVRTYPRGLDIEIFNRLALAKCYKEATLTHQREHVTPYIYENDSLFSIYHQCNEKNLSEHRWTLDTFEDFIFISSIYNKFTQQNNNCIFTTNDVLNLLEHELLLKEINKGIEQKSTNQGEFYEFKK